MSAAAGPSPNGSIQSLLQPPALCNAHGLPPTHRYNTDKDELLLKKQDSCSEQLASVRRRQRGVAQRPLAAATAWSQCPRSHSQAGRAFCTSLPIRVTMRRLLLAAADAQLRGFATLAAPGPRVAVVGGGVAGLAAAKELVNHGVACTLLDMGDGGVGGRLVAAAAATDLSPGCSSQGRRLDLLSIRHGCHVCLAVTPVISR